MRKAIRRLLVLLFVMLLALPAGAFADAAKDYNKAQELLVKNRYAEAAEAFGKLGSYADASMLAMYSQACALAEAGDFDTAIYVLTSMGDYKDCPFRVIYYTARAHEAAAGTDTWETMLDAQAVYRTIPLFLDSGTRITALDGRIAAAKQSQYDAAVAACEAGNYSASEKAFRRLGDYRDSAKRVSYVLIRADEAALAGTSDQDKLIALANRYRKMAMYFDCADRASAMTAQADVVVADKYARADTCIAEGRYAEAEKLLAGFGTYGNEQVPDKYYALGEHAMSTESWDVAVNAFRKAGNNEDADVCLTYVTIRRDEAALTDTADQDALIAIANRYAPLMRHFDCVARIVDLTARADAIVADKYAQVDALTAEGKYTDAEAILAGFGTYGNGEIAARRYAIGVHATDAGQWGIATASFKAAGSYSDAKTRITYVAIRKDESALTTTTNQDTIIAVAKRYTAMGDYLDCAGRAAALTAQADAIVADKYAQVDALIAQGNYSGAERLLNNFGTYGNGQIKAMRYAIGVHALEAGNFDKATSVFKELGNYADSKDRLTYIAIRRDETALAGSNDQDKVIAVAKRYAAMGAYRDCADRALAVTAQADAIVAAKCARVDKLTAEGKYTDAERILNNFGTYGKEHISAKRYAIGMHALEAGNWDKANKVFVSLGSYSDAPKRVNYVKVRKSEALLGNTTDQDKIISVVKSYLSMGDVFDCADRAAALTARADAIVAEKLAQVDELTAEGRYTQAESILGSFGNYGSEQITARRYAIGVHALEAGNWDKATTVFRALGSYSDSRNRITYTGIRKDEAALGNITDQDKVMAVASRYISMGAYLDCADRAAALTARADAIVADKYALVDARTAEGKYDEAEQILNKFGVYGNEQITAKRYAIGVHAQEAGDWSRAATIFEGLGSYSDAKARFAYVSIRRDEEALTGSIDQDAVKAVAERYTAMGEQLDCAARATALNARVDAIVADKYAQADALIAAGDYAGAWESLGGFGTYGNEQLPARYYAAAELARAAGHNAIAVAAYRAAGDYSNAAAMATSLQPLLNRLMAAGGSHSVALRDDGTVVAIGLNEDGQCTVGEWRGIVAVAAGYRHTVGLRGDGTVVARGYNTSSQCKVSDWNKVIAIAAGTSHTVGLRSDGTVVAVGRNSNGQCKVTDWKNIVAIAAGDDFTVGLRADGTVVAVGDNEFGQCDVKGWKDIVAIAAGSNHTIGLRADGTLVEIGDNGYSQCDVRDWTGIVAIAAGGNRTLGLRADGTVVAIGWNGDGQGNVSGWEDIVAIAASEKHTLGLRADGTIVTAGNNDKNQCTTAIWRDIVDVASGECHTVGLRKDGTVIAVGNNDSGQCRVSGWTDIVAVASGSSHTVGLRADGTVVAAGNNRYKQCNVTNWTNIVAVSAGNEHTVGLRADGTVVAVGNSNHNRCKVTGWTNIIAIAAGGSHTVALRADGTVVATGSNSSGQCNVTGWRDIVAIAAGGSHTLGLRADGTVVAVGDNGSSQRTVSGWEDIVAIAAGSSHSIGLQSDGTVVAVGSNIYGQCSVTSWKDITAISAYKYCTAGLRKDGTVVATGSNYYCQCNTFIWDLFD